MQPPEVIFSRSRRSRPGGPVKAAARTSLVRPPVGLNQAGFCPAIKRLGARREGGDDDVGRALLRVAVYHSIIARIRSGGPGPGPVSVTAQLSH